MCWHWWRCFERKGWRSNPIHLVSIQFRACRVDQRKRRKLYRLTVIGKSLVNRWRMPIVQLIKRTRLDDGEDRKRNSIDRSYRSDTFVPFLSINSVELIEFIVGVNDDVYYILWCLWQICHFYVMIIYFYFDFKIEELYHVEIEHEKYVRSRCK